MKRATRLSAGTNLQGAAQFGEEFIMVWTNLIPSYQCYDLPYNIIINLMSLLHSQEDFFFWGGGGLYIVHGSACSTTAWVGVKLDLFLAARTHQI